MTDSLTRRIAAISRTPMEPMAPPTVGANTPRYMPPITSAIMNSTGPTSVIDLNLSFQLTCILAEGMVSGLSLPIIMITRLSITVRIRPGMMPATRALPMETSSRMQNMIMGTLGGMSTDNVPEVAMQPMLSD